MPEPYVQKMKSRAENAFDSLFDGVGEVVFVDFPDHRNVGDSAIALGTLAYLQSRGIRIKSIHCIGTFSSRILESRVPVVINGGGNIAGFFDGIDRHRNTIGAGLTAETLLIQGPQSVHFNNEQARQRFTDMFASRPNLRLAVRDSVAVDALKGIYDRPLLVPDSAHLLGAIDAPEPTQDYVVLKRQDRESASGTGVHNSFDWPDDRGVLALTTSLRWKSKYAGPLKAVFNLSPQRWERAAQLRFRRGVGLLSQGDTVITDRLHAMLLSLQMGRRVIAVDNNNQKLSKYADSWFGDSGANVLFAPDFDTAVDMV